MGLDTRDRGVIPEALTNAVAEEGHMLSRIAEELAAKVAIEPRQLLRRDIELSEPGIWSPNRHCRLVKAADDWIAVNLPRTDDRDAVAAWLECDPGRDPWDAVAEMACDQPSAQLKDQAALLGLPVAVVGETPIPRLLPLKPSRSELLTSSVIDLSALWAGPLCGGLLAEAGFAVTKIEDPARRDPIGTTTPEHDRRLNGRKYRITMPLSDPQLLERITRSRILITSARPHALARLGLKPDTLFARNPELIWVAITAHGFTGDQAIRVGFGDDTAAAGGLVALKGDEPNFLGDALADPLTGLRAARLALQAVANCQSGLIDVALAPTSADFAQRAGLR